MSRLSSCRHARFARTPRLCLLVGAVLALGMSVGSDASDESARPMGTIRTPYPEFGLLLMPVTDAGAEAVDEERVEGKGGTARVPAGRYHLMQWRVGALDKAGRRWEAKGTAWPEPIVVPAGGSLDLPLGAPLRAHLQGVESNRVMHFHLEYAGPRGERCRGVTVDGEAPTPPVVRIFDSAGRVVGRTRFAKKCGGTCHAAWPIPEGLAGRFRAVPEPQLGPMRLDVGGGITFDLASSRVVHPKPAVGKPAPDFMLTTPQGQSVQLGFLKGQPIFLCFFCNCGLCRAFAAEVARAGDLSKKTKILVVASDTSVAEDPSFRTETGLTDALYFHDAPPITALRYASEECPRCWLIDGKGIVRYVNVERLMPAAKLVADVRAALAKPAPTAKPVAGRPSPKVKPAARRPARDAAKQTR